LKRDAFPSVAHSLASLRDSYLLLIKLAASSSLVVMLRVIVFSDFSNHLYPKVVTNTL